MSSDEELESFRSHLETRGLEPEQLATKIEPTMSVGSARTLDYEGTRRRIHTLPQLAVGPAHQIDRQLDLGLIETLGEGGMGVVRLAKQVALDREVAVKTTRSDTGAAVGRALLAEAFVTGFLEHPNIIPVYLVGRDSEGAPLIVMKRVEGRSWLEIIEAHRAGGGVDWSKHVDILIQVAGAVRFAHSRRIVHRDIKPENVMVGEFDEVYLLDWGIALDLQGDRPLLPARSEASSICGTPGYMAPEMVRQRPGAIDERTDVYLLGATLHHLLAGRPRHTGETMLEQLHAAAHSRPCDYPAGVPKELAEIANRACRRDPQRRFDDVEQFRDALRDFLDHRESIALSDSAHQKLEELQNLVDAQDPNTPAIHDTWGECRFGFEQALRIWPHNPEATEGFQRCLESMADYHLHQRNPEGARSCLADLPEPRPELEERVERLERELGREHEKLQRLEKLERNLDATTAAGTRSLVMVVLGLLWTASTTYVAVRTDQGLISHQEELRNHAVSGVRNLGIVAAAMFVFRSRLMANAVNRRLVYLFSTMLVVLALLRGSVWHLDADLVVGRTADTAVYILALVAVGLLTDLRVCLVAVAFLVAGVIGVVWPDLQLYANAGGAAATFGALAWIWAPSRVKQRLWPF